MILPGHPLFEETLQAVLPFDWQQIAHQFAGEFAFVVKPGSGILEAVSCKEAGEYALGGEYDERLLELDNDYY